MKDKTNLLLIFLVIVLTLNLFNPNNKKTDPKTGFFIEMTKNTFSIPAKVNFNIKNNTSTSLKIDTCSDLVIKNNSEEIKLNNCWEKNIETNESINIDFSKQFKDFYNTWKYNIVLKNKEVDITESFEVKQKWIISKIFITIFYAPIYNLMILLLSLSNYSLGLSIIAMTVLIRLALIYPQQKMLENNKKMQIVQPKIKALQEKHKWDHQTIWMELMNLYKEHKINPMWNMWIMMIQMPILIVMYRTISGIQNIVSTFYIYPTFKDFDLNMINSNFLWIDLFSKWGVYGLIFAIIVWLLQFIQIKLSLSKNNSKKIELKKKESTNDLMPDAEMLNKSMMLSMPIIVGFFTYNFFLWVGLYWSIWTIFMIVQQLIVNKKIKKVD